MILEFETCYCRCHTNKKLKHVMPCCENGKIRKVKKSDHIAVKVNRDEFKCSCGFGPKDTLTSVAEHIKEELKKANAD